MLTVEEIKMFIDEDAASVKKHFARIGERYFDGDHDIKNYRMFYFNSDGQLVEDTSRANVRIPHPFFKELTEQGTQYTLSGSDGFVFSDVPELQSELDARFNNNDDFIDELSETLTDCQTKGFAYMYAMKDSTDKLKFTCADSIGVVEVEARFDQHRCTVHLNIKPLCLIVELKTPGSCTKWCTSPTIAWFLILKIFVNDTCTQDHILDSFRCNTMLF